MADPEDLRSRRACSGDPGVKPPGQPSGPKAGHSRQVQRRRSSTCSGWKHLLLRASRSSGKKQNTEQKRLARERSWGRLVSKPETFLNERLISSDGLSPKCQAGREPYTDSSSFSLCSCKTSAAGRARAGVATRFPGSRRFPRWLCMTSAGLDVTPVSRLEGQGRSARIRSPLKTFPATPSVCSGHCLLHHAEAKYSTGNLSFCRTQWSRV